MTLSVDCTQTSHTLEFLLNVASLMLYLVRFLVVSNQQQGGQQEYNCLQHLKCHYDQNLDIQFFTFSYTIVLS